LRFYYSNSTYNLKASAITYFKRFFLRNTLIDFDPKKYIFACLYLALKTEEVHIESFDDLAKKFNDPFFNSNSS